jgi:uncharacterized protein YkwD
LRSAHVGLLVGLVLLASLTVPQAATAKEASDCGASSFGLADDGMGQALLALINKARVKAHAEPLTELPRLQDVARQHSLDMAQRRYFDHVSSDGGALKQRLAGARIRHRARGEALVWTSASVKHAFSALKKSEPHWKLLMNPAFRYAGVGVVSCGRGEGLMVTVDVIKA